MTRKRFIKLVMAKGSSRNQAYNLARWIREGGCVRPDYKKTFQNLRFWQYI